MKKLRLDPDLLCVQSFATADPSPEDARGTAHAHEDTVECLEPTWSSCAGMDTCPKTYCGGPTCGLTCWPGCTVQHCP